MRERAWAAWLQLVRKDEEVYAAVRQKMAKFLGLGDRHHAELMLAAWRKQVAARAC